MHEAYELGRSVFKALAFRLSGCMTLSKFFNLFVLHSLIGKMGIMMNYSLSHSPNEHLLYSSPWTRAGDTRVNVIDQNSCPHGVYILERISSSKSSQ